MNTKSPSSSAMAAAREIVGEIEKVLPCRSSGSLREKAISEVESIITKHMQIPEGQWRPIESAPKGQILLYTKATTGRSPLQALIRIGYKGDWPFRETTHWMPLPAPPKEDEPEGENLGEGKKQSD